MQAVKTGLSLLKLPSDLTDTGNKVKLNIWHIYDIYISLRGRLPIYKGNFVNKDSLLLRLIVGGKNKEKNYATHHNANDFICIASLRWQWW